jgi:hypothetical protein
MTGGGGALVGCACLYEQSPPWFWTAAEQADPAFFLPNTATDPLLAGRRPAPATAPRHSPIAALLPTMTTRVVLPGGPWQADCFIGPADYRFSGSPVMPQTSWSIGSGSVTARFTQVIPWRKTGRSAVLASESSTGTMAQPRLTDCWLNA